MTSSKGDYLLSAYDEDIAVDHRPAEVLAASCSTRIALSQWSVFEAEYIYSLRVQACFWTGRDHFY